jgi:2'-5' RNA ligase
VPFAVVWLIADEEKLAGNGASIARDLWRRIEAVGHTTPGSLGFDPHVTVCVFDRCDPEAVAAALEGIDLGLGRRVNFNSISSFRDSGVVYLSVADVGGALRAIHGVAFERLEPMAHGVSPYYRPERWIPHCTLAERLTERAVEAVAALAHASHHWPIEGCVTARIARVCLIEFLPVVVHRQW